MFSSFVPPFNLCSAQNAVFVFLAVFVVFWRTHQVHLSQVELGAAQSLPALPPQGAELHDHLCRLHSGEHFLQDGKHLQRQKKKQHKVNYAVEKDLVTENKLLFSLKYLKVPCRFKELYCPTNTYLHQVVRNVHSGPGYNPGYGL